jgi:hypothetical protein
MQSTEFLILNSEENYRPDAGKLMKLRKRTALCRIARQRIERLKTRPGFASPRPDYAR